MKRKKTISIVICLASIITAMTILYWTSPLSKKLEPSSFTRNFVNTNVIQQSVLELDNKNPYISGIDANNIYLGDYHRPYFLIKCKSDLSQREEIELRMQGVDSVKKPGEFRTSIDSPYFYMANGVMPIILRGKTKNWTAEPFIHDNKYYFTDMLPITNSSLVLRSFSTFQKGLQLARLNKIDTPYFKFNFNLLKHQQDGLFSVHGYILPYKKENKFVYLYTYRNQYLIIDSTLESYQTRNTIDTFNIAPIKIGSYENKTQYTLSSTPNIINGPSCISDNHLYIKSMLLAKNENTETFLESSTIDVYDLNLGKYELSFHIPNFEKESFSEFRIIGDKIFTVQKNKIILYKFSSPKNDNIAINTSIKSKSKKQKIFTRDRSQE